MQIETQKNIKLTFMSGSRIPKRPCRQYSDRTQMLVNVSVLRALVTRYFSTLGVRRDLSEAFDFHLKLRNISRRRGVK